MPERLFRLQEVAFIFSNILEFNNIPGLHFFIDSPN